MISNVGIRVWQMKRFDGEKQIENDWEVIEGNINRLIDWYCFIDCQ